ncbi:MAG: pyrroline-5-carboxylate reductase [Candidatus Riflebacteria bacterium GWC2_50_8]|nr:MAG: pyrroline-5-carboxylate reductase [Candidatus Riflebacteria bacterium GWC2_50_8]
MNKKIAIIGGGNLGSAIARGLIYTKAVKPALIHVTRRRVEMLSALAEAGITVGSDNVAAVKGAKIVLLAVKPYQIAEVCEELKGHFAKDAILISLATGIENQKLVEMTDSRHAIFRAMPNTAVAIGESMTCLAAINETPEQKKEVEDFFTRLGNALFIPEELMAGATVLAACGIAFALRFIRAATQGGIEIGFSSDLALKIASQTVKGAAQLIIEGETHPEAEIDKVTTPRGITISGLNEMEHQGFSSSLIKGLITSFKKIENVSK